MSKRVAIYVRVSSSHQEKEGASLETQEAACRRYAIEHGWVIDEEHVYRETHKRWLLHERPEMSRLRDDAKAGRFDVVLCYCVDRLSSMDAHVYILDEEFSKCGVVLEFATEKFETTAIGNFVRSAKVLAAAIEVEKIKERTIRGRKNRVANGKRLPGGKPLYGYRWPDEFDSKGRQEKGRLIEDPETAPVVRRIYRELAAGCTLRQIANALTEEGVPTPGGLNTFWRTGTIARMLHQPDYKGEAYGWTRSRGTNELRDFEGGEAIKLPAGTVPALVDAATWDAVQLILQHNKARSIRSAKDPEGALLRGGFVRCGYCGSSMYPRPRSNGKLEYVCKRGTEYRSGCLRPTVVAHRLDDDVWRRVRNILLDPTIIREKLQQQVVEEFSPLEDQLQVNAAALIKVEKQQETTAAAISMVTSSGATAPLISRLEQLDQTRTTLLLEQARLQELMQAHRAQQADLSDLETWCATVASNLADLTYKQKRMALDVLGLTVSVYRSNVTPRWNVNFAITSGHEMESIPTKELVSLTT